MERPEPPTYKIYSTAVGSTEWANLTEIVHSSYMDVNLVSLSPDRETVAVLSTGEGHSDVAVSRNGKLLCETAVYPGVIDIVGWSADGSLLFVVSDMPLHMGLDAELRTKNSAWDESMRDGIDEAVYAIDPEEGRAEAVDPSWVPDPTVSPDGRWKLHLIDDGKGASDLFLTPRQP